MKDTVESKQEAVVPRALYEQAQQEIAYLEQQLAELKRLIFGSRSERFVPTDPKQLALFEGLERQLAAKKQVQAQRPVTRPAKSKPVRALLPAHLPREEEVIEPADLPTGSVKIGEEVTEVLEYHPGRLFVRRIVRPKYAVAQSEPAGDVQPVMIASLPSLPIPKGNAGAGLLAHLQVSKYVDHQPYYRQIQILKRSGVTLSDSTINGWFNSTAELLVPLYDCLKQHVLGCDYLQADESPIKVLDANKKRTTHTGYHWVYHSPEHKLVLFDYQPGRGREGPERLLKDFTGILQTDGYQAYQNLNTEGDIILSACMAHARRKFEHALDNDRARAQQALGLIGQLYAIEREVKDLDIIQRQAMRQQKAVPVLDALQAWLDEHHHQLLPKSAIGQAVSYTLKLWPRLRLYTKDGRLQIDNNLIENAIRPLALGRKNYLFAGSHQAAQRAAMMYSFFATCKVNEIEPYQWLKHVLDRIPEHKANRLADLLPLGKA